MGLNAFLQNATTGILPVRIKISNFSIPQDGDVHCTFDLASESHAMVQVCIGFMGKSTCGGGRAFKLEDGVSPSDPNWNRGLLAMALALILL